MSADFHCTRWQRTDGYERRMYIQYDDKHMSHVALRDHT